MFNEAQIIRTVFIDLSNTEADKEFKRRAAFDKEFVENMWKTYVCKQKSIGSSLDHSLTRRKF